MNKAIVSRLVAAAWLSLLMGCGNGTGPSDAANARCTITITGAPAIAGTYTCPQSAVTIWVSNTNVSATSINVSGSTSITGLFAFSGQPASGTTYTSAASTVSQSYGIIVTVGSATWQFAAGQLFTPLGSGSLSYTSVAQTSSGPAGNAYAAHGTMDATLVPSPGTTASGNATIHIAF
jgi:hypothetical protein